ncbi:MAG: MarR family transcriptional regulator [Gammaproteobacteria bacterium]|jgi:MarR family transcriptional regulator for hemolysin|uniref:MarR family winged helix-turn-helix transcriptional regulator n=1 Tax=Acidiferrobacter sp. SPIII_3 TaxID=1281578 RepID=UPI000D739146|nr:MarR family transcriptional regulator [Acidiferrobacter sp. SPIII_3]AWP22664.1 MarR family transcriptional regulator [Acidiferrobacter sp. SPIII_3]MDA8120466.1 MarR family transcriptional regulator [Gammaproteobacteria bacterium]
MGLPQESFAGILHETARLWRTELDRRLRPLGLSQAKWRMLVHIACSEDCTQAELAARLGVEAPTVVGLLDRLTADGLVERRESPHDRRSKTVHLCEGGRALMRPISEMAEDLSRELLTHLSAEEVTVTTAALKKIRDRLLSL